MGVGLLYRTGYFRQHVGMDGQQQESYPANDFYNLPLTLCTAADGTPLTVAVELGEELAHAQVWRVLVGRVTLYLLDTDLEANDPSTRHITSQLYVADRHTRLRQELLLGIGGIRALRALQIPLAVTHMNEGHSAFLGLERVRAPDERAGDELRRGAAGGVVYRRVHHPYPGAGGQREFRRRAGARSGPQHAHGNWG